MPRYRILVIEDEELIREAVCTYLNQNGNEAIPASSCREGNRLMQSSRPDAVLLDYSLSDGNAMDLLRGWQGLTSRIPVIILSGHGSIELAVDAVKLGAADFLTKPADLATLLMQLNESIETSQRKIRPMAEGRQPQNPPRRDPFIGTSEAVRQLANLATRVAASDSTVLIEGETGTGKGVLARWIHDNSSRAKESYVDLNCGGLSSSLMESELFGYERGAFTGAVQAKPGLFEIAHHGTAFLDEIGDMELQVQPKLLKVLEEKELRRIGEVKTRKVDIRLISATHQNLKESIEAKSFRSDLYFRINTITIALPPLTARMEDIPALTDWFLKSFAIDGGSPCEITAGAREELASYNWPGNVRELRNVLERASVLADGHVITTKNLQFGREPVHREQAAAKGLDVKTLEQMEIEHIESVLALENGKVECAARKLGVPRSSLYHKLKNYGIGRRYDRYLGAPR